MERFATIEERGHALKRLAVALVAAVALLAAGLGFAPASGWAESTVKVALTVVDTTDGTVVYNDAVEVAEGATVADAFTAAGFTEAASEDASSSTSYYNYWSCPEFLGKGYDATTGYYWVTMYEGDGSYPTCASAYLTATVVDGAHYQYVYADYSTTSFSYDEDDTVSVQLTVVDTTDSTVVYNAAVTVAEGATVADAFAAAGFTEAASEDASTSTSYYNSWSCPEFLGKGYDATTGYYWVTMYEGDGSYPTCASAYLTATVADGAHYQYVYASYTTTSFAYDDTVADLVTASVYDPLSGYTAGSSSETTATTVTVALTIVDTTDGTVIYNAAVEVAEGATVADAFTAAGFTEVDEESASTSTSYYSSYSCPEFLGKGYDATTGYYWVTMYEGDGSYPTCASAYLTATVVDGAHYQYVYAYYTTTTFEYTDEIADPLAATSADDSSTTDDSTTDATETEGAATYDATSTATLLENLTERFSDGGSDEAISNSTVYAAIALNALGLGSQIDTDAILASLESYEETYGYSIGAGTLAKYIMALTAGGYDCTELVAQMEALEDGSENIYSTVWILAVYDYGGYAVGSGSAWTLDALIDAIIESIGDEGLVGAWGYYDTQTTAQAILALAAYADDAEVAAALSTMAAGLAAYQNADGGYGYASYSTASNLDATANIVAALAALDYDTTDAVAWLVAQADSTLDGYTTNSSYDEAMTSSTVLMALAAYEVAPTSVYELVEATANAESTDEDADDGSEGEDADEDGGDSEGEDADDDDTSDEEDGTSDTDDDGTSDEEDADEDEEDETLTSTGDTTATLVMATGSLAVALLATGAALKRRRAPAPVRHARQTRR